ncbi:hypothetical protein D3C85_912250 [compost metagenome]
MGTPLSNDHGISTECSRIVTGTQQIAQRLFTALCRFSGLSTKALAMEAITPQQLGDKIQRPRIAREVQDVPGVIEDDLAPLIDGVLHPFITTKHNGTGIDENAKADQCLSRHHRFEIASIVVIAGEEFDPCAGFIIKHLRLVVAKGAARVRSKIIGLALQLARQSQIIPIDIGDIFTGSLSQQAFLGLGQPHIL